MCKLVNWPRWGQTLEQSTLYLKLSPFLTCGPSCKVEKMIAEPTEGVSEGGNRGKVVKKEK